MKNDQNKISGSSALCRAVFLAVMLTSISTCRPQSEKEEAVTLRDINAVLETHDDKLMAIPGVTGVAVGALDDGTPCILVLVLEGTDEVTRKIPKTLEGHPVRIFVSGEIKPMDSD